MSEIVFENVGHSFGERTVLQQINLRLSEQRIGIVGANGSGKSTLARMINGLVVPTEGHVHVNGLDTAKKGRDVRKQVGFVFTDPNHQIVMPTVARTSNSRSAVADWAKPSAPQRWPRCSNATASPGTPTIPPTSFRAGRNSSSRSRPSW
ncbi:hypothetical protein N806_18445 [Rhodococcus sp. P27]|nr:hypothetical protein N806_18445 [Rhodococcus sp. P27]